MSRNIRANIAVIFLTTILMNLSIGQETNLPTSLPKLGDELTDEQVCQFAELALKGIHIEYPNKPSNVMADESSVQSPRAMHPAFYGCFDWHSSVHGHWMLVRLMRMFPDCSKEADIRKALAKNLTAENLIKEAKYFQQKHNRSFERMYGWAWLLRLVMELEQWDDPQGNQWRTHIKPLEKIIVERTMDYLPRLSYPIRTGVHPDSGFALGQTLDYARQTKNVELEKLIVDRCLAYFSSDKNYPSNYEPSGEDFFSSGLNEADLLRRVMKQAEFSEWLESFLPEISNGKCCLFQPVEVSDVTDGKIVHLAGLDLSRGWCLQGIASALPANDRRIKLLRDAARAHADAGYKYVFSGHYEGEHWLATFAIYLHTNVGVANEK